MKNIRLALIALVMVASFSLEAQVGINTDGSDPDASAILDVKSTTQGVLFPRMTEAQILDIQNPANGLVVFNTDVNRLYFYDSSAGNWKELSLGSSTLSPWACGADFTDSRDGKTYATVQIDNLCWMAENLNVGTQILQSTSTLPTDNGTIEKYCYQDDPANCTLWGGLYYWDEMMEYSTTAGAQGICPSGWRVATHDDWCTMENFVDAGTISCSVLDADQVGTDVGTKLKATSGWSTNSGTNISGFTALPGGTISGLTFYGGTGDFWTALQFDPTHAWARRLRHNQATTKRFGWPTNTGMSVRCVKN
ncbi:MAG: hypothetical protein K9H64_04640 [Bacteroidales bacterium]|nr:hypothetical protein [Bacteroidales bacterium]MCF8455108.1 hypothetical protein [Bacteroidales bacterium]